MTAHANLIDAKEPPHCPTCGCAAGSWGSWQSIETAPKYTELLVYRKDAGVMLGIYTSPDQFTPESHWDETAEALGDAFEAEDWFLFCWDGAERADGDLAPTHWMPLPMPPSSAGPKP